MKAQAETPTLQAFRKRRWYLSLGRDFRKPAVTLAVAAASVVVAGVASPASASSQGASDEAAAAVIAAEDTIAGNAVVMEVADGAVGYESSANGVDVVIPMDPSSGMESKMARGH